MKKDSLSESVTRIGAGDVGDKALHLAIKEEEILEIGFSIPNTTAVASDVLNEILRKNDVPNGVHATEAQLPDNLAFTKVPSYCLAEFANIAKKFAGAPVVIRSSGPGDAIGMGVYESVIVPPTVEAITKGFQEVLHGYFSEHALDFRQGKPLTENAGIIIQKAEGRDRGRYFSPAISGYAFTSAKRGEPLVNVAFGFGGGVHSRRGVRIDADVSEQFSKGGSLYDILAERAFDAQPIFAHGRSPKPKFDKDRVEGNVFLYGKKGLVDGRTATAHLHMQRNSLDALRRMNIHDIRGRLQGLEAYFGPQYIEWVGTPNNNGRMDLSVVQIADKPQGSEVHLPAGVRPMYTAHTVSGRGRCDVSNLVYVPGVEALNDLLTYNKQMPQDSYALIFPASLVTQEHFGTPRMELKHFSNAAALLEIPDEVHERDPVSHLAGEAEALNKLFGVCSVCPSGLSRKLMREGHTTNGGLQVAAKPLAVYSDPFEDTLRVYDRNFIE